MGGRPRSDGYYRYGCDHVLSECGVASNELSLRIPAPGSADEVIWLAGYAANIGHSGSAGRLDFATQAGVIVWTEPLPTTDIWYSHQFEHPIPLGVAGAGAMLKAANTELSVGEVYVHYQIM